MRIFAQLLDHFEGILRDPYLPAKLLVIIWRFAILLIHALENRYGEPDVADTEAKAHVWKSYPFDAGWQLRRRDLTLTSNLSLVRSILDSLKCINITNG